MTLKTKMPRDRGKKKRKAHGKFRKNGREELILTNDDIEFLVEKTSFDAMEISEWFSGFIADNPEGTLTKVKMMEMYSVVLTFDKATLFVDQIFAKFDTDSNGSIDFKEFMLATNIADANSSQEKLRWAFRMYDEDSSGSIDVNEMFEIIGNLYEMEGVSKDMALERAKAVFELLDENSDGEINEEEFVHGCLQDQNLISLLNSGNSGAI